MAAKTTVTAAAPTAGNGLEGVVAARTRLSDVDGERGELTLAGYRVDEIAGRATFEDVTWLLWHGDLPSAGEAATFRAALASKRALAGTDAVTPARVCAPSARSDACTAHGRRHALPRSGR